MANVTASDLAHFYTTELLGELKQLDQRRKAVLGKVWTLFAVVGSLLTLCAVTCIYYQLPPGYLMLGIVGCVGAGSFFYKSLISGYVHEFKLRVIKRMVAFLDPSLTYWPKGHISKTQFNGSRIFTRYPDRMRGDDLVKGKIGQTIVEFSELHAQYKRESTTRSGARRRSYHTIFKGLFFIADFNKKFYGKTVVLPDTAEKLLGGFGSFFQSLNRGRGELIKLEDPEFEKNFVVYGDDQIESRYVLSTSLMQRIVEFRKKTGKRIYLSFVGSEVFVAVPYKRGLFEPKVFSSIIGFSGVKEYFEDLQLALGIVEDLNLNTRIWSKREAPSESRPIRPG